MQEVQLYIQGQRIDLFKDEIISLTQSIQNIKDPAKIFTEFSKTFTIPANKENNKIFKHYYNYNIVNGYDARLKVSGEIKLNYLTFKKGFIKLEGVDLKDNKPNLYRITFFGETVSLKDLIGEDKLSALSWLDNFYVRYDSTNIKSYLQNAYVKTVNGTLYTDAVLTPLISHTSRWYFDSSSGHHSLPNAENNLHHDNATGHNHGALYSDMKYSIRVHLIIKAIEQKYNIEFSTDFFNTGNTDYYGLYMWMHRKKGDVQGQVTGAVVYSTLVDTWNDTSYYPNTDGITITISRTPSIDYISSQLTIDPVNDAIKYNIKIYKNGNIWDEYNNVSGNQIKYFTHYDSESTADYNSSDDFTIYLESSEALFFNPISWSFDFFDSSGVVYSDTFTASGINIGAEFDFYPTQQIPDIKILDFLTGLFKMFNLTSYVDNGVIVVDTLDNFYQTYNTYDISQYVDTSKSSVNVALPYKQIDFNFKDYKTFLAAVFNQLNNKEFGQLKYNGGDNSNNWVGGIYKVELPFQKIMYERLIDLDDNSDTTIQWGYFVDDNQDSYYGLPLLHYVKRQTGGNSLSFRDGIGHSIVYTYYIPLNSNGITGSEQSLHFSSETDEYSKVFNNNSLFENYYKNYIINIFNTKSRIIKTKAFLPLKILLKFNLSDRFIISGKSYKINSIETNLQTGESSIELLNDL